MAQIKNRQIAIGCGIVGLLAVLAFVLVLMLARAGGPAFLAFGIGTDLSKYRDTIRKMDFDEVKRDHLVDAIDDVRVSLDEGNNIGMFQWIEIDASIDSMLRDGEIDDSEYDSLLTEIARMKKIQGIVDE